MRGAAGEIAIAGVLSALLFSLAATPLIHGQTSPPPAVVRVTSISLSDIGTDGAAATVRLSAMANNSGTLRELVFDDVTIDGVRVRVAPVQGPIRLKAGEPIEGLSDLQAEVTYRELDSLEPLRRVVSEGNAQLHGSVRAQLELNLFQKLILRTVGPWVNLKIDQQVPVDIPGGTLGRIGALAVLTAAEPVWIAGQSAQEWRRNRHALADQVRRDAPGHVVSFETRYELRSAAGERAPMSHRSSGFMIGNGRVLGTVESVEPWLFDVAVAEALGRGDVTLDTASVEILANLAPDSSGGSRSYSLQRKELALVRKPGGAEDGISIDTRRKYKVRFRSDDSNSALFEIPALKRSENGLETAREPVDGPWQTAAVVRFDPEGPGTDPVPWLTEVRLEGGRYRLKDLVDSTAFGSPLWLDGRVVGLVQDEGSAAEISGLLKRMR